MFFEYHKMSDRCVDTKECKQGSVERVVYQKIQVLRCFQYIFVLKTDRILESYRYSTSQRATTETVKRVDETFP
jgi:hypothetical protein